MNQEEHSLRVEIPHVIFLCFTLANLQAQEN